MAELSQPRLVKAVFNFKGANNDELNFQKGDLITITQVVEGGWWEGTLNGKTGWFPSNYVKETKTGDPRAATRSPTPGKPSEEPAVSKRESVFYYHNVVLQSVLESERQLVSDLQSILRCYLRPLEKANILTNIEYSQLAGNLEEITALHQNILTALTQCDKQAVPQQRIGGMFLKQAAALRRLYEAYCRNHPRAVEVLQRKKDILNTFMEQQGAKTPGIMKLTTSLSVPFTRLDKYSSLLKELERHTDESHVDRGDTQRAISVYREISLSCTEIRRQKDMEREIMSTPIHQWEGEKQNLVDYLKPSYRCKPLDSYFLIIPLSAVSFKCLMLGDGGGTGSGVGTFVLRLLEDEYPDVYRFVTAVYPSAEDDVITSPYNSVLAMHQLTEHADCVLPVENQALVDITNKITAALPPTKFGKKTFTATNLAGNRVKTESALTASDGGATKQNDEKPFDSMNNIVANMLLNITSSARFEGSLNVDLNEITMNLVPFPKLHYLISSQTPLYALGDIKIPPRRLDQMFSDAFSHEHQLIKADPKHSLYLACALMVRGNVEVSDIRRNIERLRPNLHFIHWNQEGWKTGLCSVAPVGHPYSLLTLANNTAIRHNFTDLKDRFTKLYKRKAHTHHYNHVDGFDMTQFDEASESLTALIAEYSTLDKQMKNPPPPVPRLQIVT